MSKNNWYVIVNPQSNRGKCLREWPMVNSQLRDAGIDFEVNFTLRKFHAVEMAAQAIESGCRKIIVVGGDGTLSEVVHGIMLQKRVPSSEVTIALFAQGVNNNWVRMYGVPKTYSEMVRALLSERTILQDVGRVTCFESKVLQERYMCNSGGIAYDARVCRRANKLISKGYTRSWIFRLAAYREIFKFKRPRVTIVCDGGEVYSKKLFSATIGIGRYSNHAMPRTPYAIADDGLFDMTVVRRMTLLRMVLRLRSLRSGNIYNLKGVEMFRAKSISITTNRAVQLEVDGENCGVSDFTFEIVPRALRVLVSFSSH